MVIPLYFNFFIKEYKRDLEQLNYTICNRMDNVQIACS